MKRISAATSFFFILAATAAQAQTTTQATPPTAYEWINWGGSLAMLILGWLVGLGIAFCAIIGACAAFCAVVGLIWRLVSGWATNRFGGTTGGPRGPLFPVIVAAFVLLMMTGAAQADPAAGPENPRPPATKPAAENPKPPAAAVHYPKARVIYTTRADGRQIRVVQVEGVEGHETIVVPAPPVQGATPTPTASPSATPSGSPTPSGTPSAAPSASPAASPAPAPASSAPSGAPAGGGNTQSQTIQVWVLPGGGVSMTPPGTTPSPNPATAGAPPVVPSGSPTPAPSGSPSATPSAAPSGSPATAPAPAPPVGGNPLPVIPPAPPAGATPSPTPTPQAAAISAYAWVNWGGSLVALVMTWGLGMCLALAIVVGITIAFVAVVIFAWRQLSSWIERQAAGPGPPRFGP